MTLSKQSLILPILNPSELSKPKHRQWARRVYEGPSYVLKNTIPEYTYNRYVKIRSAQSNREMIAAACKWVQFYNSKCTNLLYVRARRLLQSQLNDPVAFKQAFEERKQAAYNEMEDELISLRETILSSRMIKLPIESEIDNIIETATKQLEERERRCNESYTTEGIVDYDRHVLRRGVF